MNLRRASVITFFGLLWAGFAASLSAGVRFGAPVTERRPFFHGAGMRIEFPALAFKPIDRALVDSSALLRSLKEWGQRLKLAAGQSQDFVFVARSERLAAQRQLALREEVADEFDTPELRVARARNLRDVAERARKLERARSVAVDALIVPTKILANELTASVWDAPFETWRRYGLGPSAPRPGSETNQRNAESFLAAEGLRVISILGEVLRARADPSRYPPYPFGETHWSRALVLRLGQTIAADIVRMHGLPARCLRAFDPAPFLAAPGSLYSGDLADALLLDPATSLGREFSGTQIPSFAAGLPAADPAPAAECPPIIYAGTSYGVIYRGEGDVAQAIGAYYRGRVTNESIAGRGRNAALEALTSATAPAGGLVIWEMPLRQLK